MFLTFSSNRRLIVQTTYSLLCFIGSIRNEVLEKKKDIGKYSKLLMHCIDVAYHLRYN